MEAVEDKPDYVDKAAHQSCEKTALQNDEETLHQQDHCSMLRSSGICLKNESRSYNPGLVVPKVWKYERRGGTLVFRAQWQTIALFLYY